MLRKISLALVAAGALGAAALASTSASAWPLFWDGPNAGWYGWNYRYDYVPAATYADRVAYCARHYKSYEPASGTFLGNDGLRHFCS